jgi:hypothetical protein
VTRSSMKDGNEQRLEEEVAIGYRNDVQFQSQGPEAGRGAE